MNTDDLPLLDLTGTPRERGRIHGETMRRSIHTLVAQYEEFLAGYFGVDPARYMDAFLTQANFLPAIEQHAPHLLDEVRGLAEGADLSFDSALHMQLIDEEWAYGFHNHAPLVQNKCTALGVQGSERGPTLSGQNMDVPQYIDGHQVLMRIANDNTDLVTYVFSYAGLIGLNGMNSGSLGICCNTLNQLEPSNDGLPVAFLVRRVLEHRTYDEAVAFIKGVKHASGQNYLISAPDAVGSFECSANQVVEFVAEDERRRTFHTNHALANTDQHSYAKRMADLSEVTEAKFKNSRARLDAISRRVLTPEHGLSFADVVAALSSSDDPQNPISRTVKDTQGSFIGFTAGSMIFEHSESPRLHIAAGPPSNTPYRQFNFDAHAPNASGIEGNNPP